MSKNSNGETMAAILDWAYQCGLNIKFDSVLTPVQVYENYNNSLTMTGNYSFTYSIQKRTIEESYPRVTFHNPALNLSVEIVSKTWDQLKERIVSEHKRIYGELLCPDLKLKRGKSNDR